MPNLDTSTLYIKMKSESGSEVWRNVAPSVGSGSKRLNFRLNDYNTPTSLNNLTNSFVSVQTEQPALDNGQVQYKIVVETYMTGGSIGTNILPGTDAWTDTTDEKLLVQVTNGNTEANSKLPRAASAIGTGSSYTDYEEAVSTYSRQVALCYQIGANTDSNSWTQTHLTGTKDTLVAQND